MLKIPSDPAQVIVNHASFRVHLGATSARAIRLQQRSPLSTAPGAARRRSAPLVWSGRTEPGDPAAGRLLQAVRLAGGTGVRAGAGGLSGGGGVSGSGVSGAGGRADADPDGLLTSTQVLPRIDPAHGPTVVGPRAPEPGPGPLRGLRALRPVRGAYDGEFADPEAETEAEFDQSARAARGGDSVRHAWYPGRRMNLGIVLLPLRIFLGLISIYAGMGKLCNPVYFDAGHRGSMIKWLVSLHPWPAAEPLRAFALAHPVGSGLTIAFLQVVVGVLTIVGLWQRVAASVGAALSVALLVTVSWRTVPVYDTPDIIYLAAWSPLVIAGAPVYSVDGRLASEAWRRLGPRSELWALRRRVLRRGTVLATLVVGLTLLTGSMLGAAVRANTTRGGLPTPTQAPPTNSLPGLPLPTPSSSARHKPAPARTKAPRKKPGVPSQAPAVPGVLHQGGTTGGGGTHPRHSYRPPQGSTSPRQSQHPSPSPTGTGSGSGGALGGLLGSGPLLGMPSGGGAGGSAGGTRGGMA